MIQTKHLHFRYVQRVLNLSGTEEIHEYVSENYLKIYHDIDTMFNTSIKIAENWPRFKNSEHFDFYLYGYKYILCIDTLTQECRTIIKTKTDGNVKKVIDELNAIEAKMNSINKQKQENDTRTRGIEMIIKFATDNGIPINDLEGELSLSINSSMTMVRELKALRERKKFLLEELLKRK